jgi:hypothetical protein
MDQQTTQLTAAGVCALMADGDTAGAQQLLRMHMHDAMVTDGDFPLQVLNQLVGAFIGVAVAASGSDAEVFRKVSADLQAGQVLG